MMYLRAPNQLLGAQICLFYFPTREPWKQKQWTGRLDADGARRGRERMAKVLELLGGVGH